MKGQPIGTIIHYFKKAGVAVLELERPLSVGARIRISGHTTDLAQRVESMEVDHNRIETARPGDNVAIKVANRVRPGDKVLLEAEEEPAATTS